MKPHLLRYVGCKQQLINEIKHHVDRLYTKNLHWVEPFCGSIVVPLYFLNYERITHFHLNDLNPQLIRFYKALQQIDTLDDVMKHFDQMICSYSQTNHVYYEYREQLNNSCNIQMEQYIALFLFINRTCFNGVSRYNKSGNFNVPLGRNQPNWNDIKERLMELHQLLKISRNKITFYNECYSDFVKNFSRQISFLYCDPPYDSTFSLYNSKNFENDDQNTLYELLQNHKGPWLLHNSNTERIIHMYNNYNIHEVTTRRRVSRSVSGRGDVVELIITNT